MLVVFISALIFISDLLLKNRKINWFLKSVLRVKQNETMNNFFAQGGGNLTSNTITFYREDQNQCYEITKQNVTVFGSTGGHDHGSSKVKLKSIVDYKWETKNYPGHLIAVHMDGTCIAYVINVNNKLSGTEGMIRVTSSGKRALIKGMTAEVLDLQFAHIEKQHILASIEVNILHIHKIDMLSDSLICNLIIEIEDPILNYIPKYDKISWCPYVPDEASDGEDIMQLLVWARGNCFQCLNINTIITTRGIGKHFTSDITDGILKLTDTSMMITWVALSPDGTTLSVGSEDGYIRFYQVYFHEQKPRCLHQWNPHNGKPISSFFFLDNLTKTATDAYWKHALTGADKNTEFKIWDCGNWNCLQTLSLKSVDSQNLAFIAEIDRTSSYLIISNIETRGLYVVQLINDMADITIREELNDSVKSKSSEKIESLPIKRANVFMKSISEFPLSSPILSFSIVDATVRKYKCQDNESFLMDELDDYDEESNTAYCVVVRMFIVQPKSVQECHILYQPTVSESADVRSTLSSESIENYKDSLIDMTIPSNPSDESNSDEHNKVMDSSISPPIKKQISVEKINKIIVSPRSSAVSHKSVSQVNLMTPDSFNTTGKKTPECVSSEVLSTILMLASVTGSTPGGNKTSENLNLLNLVNNKIIEDQEHQKYKQTLNQQKTYSLADVNSNRTNADMMASGGSSPSREVQEILSLSDYNSSSTKYYPEQAKSSDSLPNAILPQPEPLKAEESHIRNEIAFEPQSTQSATNAVDWPKVPGARNVMKHSVHLNSTSNGISAEIITANDLNAKMTQLINMVQLQSKHIAELKTEVVDLKKKNIDASENVKDLAYKTEIHLCKLLDEYLLRYEKEHKQRIESLVSVRNTQNRELRDSIIHVLNQFLFNQLTEKLSNILMIEIKTQIVPLVVSKLDSIKQQLQADISQKLTATDKVLKENISQVCKSKSIVDAFGNSVLLGVQNGLQTAYVKSMSDTLIPAYERSSQEMFKQLHNTFTLGIKEVMEQFDSYICQMQPIQDGTDDILDKVTDLRKHIDTTMLKQRNGSDISTETKKDLKSMESNLVKYLTEIIQKEVRKNFETQTASLEDSVLSAVRSQAHTPAPSVYDVQDQIKNLLSQGQINKAFHQALIANDLTLVEYTLERADYKCVFNPCALEQTVLLSLIQQISADMDNHNDIKQKYLCDGILNLNQQDPITKEHAPRVMKDLYKNCQSFLKNSPKSPLCSNIRVIMMAVQGMGFKVI